MAQLLLSLCQYSALLEFIILQGAFLVAQMIKNMPAKQKTHNAEDPGLILGLGRILRDGIGYPLQRDLVSALNSIH